ncbi:hypothetical protein V6N13_091836 [Hibiscus sabdariffa]
MDLKRSTSTSPICSVRRWIVTVLGYVVVLTETLQLTVGIRRWSLRSPATPRPTVMEWGTAERFRLRGDGRVIGKVEGGWFVVRLRAVGGFSVHGWALRWGLGNGLGELLGRSRFRGGCLRFRGMMVRWVVWMDSDCRSWGMGVRRYGCWMKVEGGVEWGSGEGPRG